MKKYHTYDTIHLIIAGGLLMAYAHYAQAKTIEHFTLPENQDKNLPFSEAVRVGNTVYLSGQIGIPPGKSSLVPGGIQAEAHQTMTNIGLILRHFKLYHHDIVECQVMLVDIRDWPKFNQVYKQFFTHPYPARSAFAGSGLALGARVEVDCIAVLPEA